ncbi:MAG: aldehyde dehydrogenase, partial [Chloroflexi bacterium]|nr:aldehyde dehydrogenase [Chloroflexota bacterium]
EAIVVDGKKIPVTAIKSPGELPWKKYGVDIAVESTGVFRHRAKISPHLDAGAKKVLLSVPAKDEIDATVVLGVNDDTISAATQSISNASCTTNCLAPLVKALHDAFGIEKGLMVTIHGYTNDQNVCDQIHTDMRRARAAAQNIIPTSTGAARAVGLVLPELNGKLNGVAFRVPTSTGSITDFTAVVSKDVTIEEINEAYIKASEGRMKGILEYNDEPLVSSDYKGNPHSCIIDGLSTMVMEKRMVKVMGWYDNEWGYSCRTADLAAMMAEKGI